MECSHCKKDYVESKIEESHDVPCYLFNGIARNIRKNQADKYGRRWLCKPCHTAYEEWLRVMLRGVAETFAKVYFREEDEDANT